jgi:succinyl-CoA synthetase alpha subunit
MAILIDRKTHLIVQGITGSQGAMHTALSLEYGVKIVGGVVPGRGGEKVHGVPVFDSVRQAMQAERVDASFILVPPQAVLEAAMEALENGVGLTVIVAENVPLHDTLKIRRTAKANNLRVIGPNTIGLISPGKSKIGVMPGFLYKEGTVGIVSRSGTLTHEVASNLTIGGIGQSTCVGIGGDPVIGTGFIEVLDLFREDPETKAVIMIGEIGGQAEEDAAVHLRESRFPKPVFAFIAGQAAPPGKRMGHAGAILEGGARSAGEKMDFLAGQGVKVARRIEDLNEMVRAAIGVSGSTAS